MLLLVSLNCISNNYYDRTITFQNHLSQSETSVGSHVQEIESLNSRLAESGKITMKLQRKIEEQDEAMDACREELTQVKMELHQEQRRMEQQVHVTHSEQVNTAGRQSRHKFQNIAYSYYRISRYEN